MAIQFYRKPNTQTGVADFYEQGTNRYIGPTEFGKGAGFVEVNAPPTPAPTPPPTTGNPNNPLATMTGEEYLKQGYYGGQKTGTTTEENPYRYTSPSDPYADVLKTRATTQPQTFEQIQEQERQRIQAQIDAINAQWTNEILPGLQQEAAGRMGQNVALQAAGGLSASPRGVAQTAQTTAYSRRVEAAERAKKDAAIASLYAGADQRAQERADAAVKLARQDEDAYFAYLKDQRSEAKENITNAFKSGITLDEIKKDTESYKKLLEDTGMTDFELNILENVNKPKESQIEYETAWRGDNLVMYGIDPTTGQMKTLTYTADELGIPQEEKPMEMGFFSDPATGQTYWYDKSNPQTDVNGKLIMTPIGGVKPKEPKAAPKKSEMDYKLDFATDRTINDMTKEEALIVYAPILGAEWVYNQYGEKAPFKEGQTQEEREAEAEKEETKKNDAYWENKLTNEPDKYYRSGNNVKQKKSWGIDPVVYTFIY